MKSHVIVSCPPTCSVTTFAVVWIEITPLSNLTPNVSVTTFAVVWIEIYLHMKYSDDGSVTTFAVVWIEILGDNTSGKYAYVTTFAVVWIEIPFIPFSGQCQCVTTFAVVWIEILNSNSSTGLPGSPPSRWCGLKLWEYRRAVSMHMSPPSRWCGLKSVLLDAPRYPVLVTTFAVVWIEINVYNAIPVVICRHHLRGGVD